MMKCSVCSEPLTVSGVAWTHQHGDLYCGTGDGSTAIPEGFIFDHRDEPQMRGRWVGRLCRLCWEPVTSHYTYGADLANRLGGHPSQYMEALK